MGRSSTFEFDGGAGTYLGTGIAAFLLTVLTAGIAFPWALVLRQKWRAKHTIIEGRRLTFLGSGGQLIGQWIVWLLLLIVTVGIYSFWLAPALQRWVVENTDFA